MLKIIQNEKQSFSISLKSEASGGPFDLTGNTEIRVCFKSGEVVTILTKTGAEITVDGDPLLGIISGALTVAQTGAMGVVGSGVIEVEVTKGAGEVTKTQILGAFSVTASVC